MASMSNISEKFQEDGIHRLHQSTVMNFEDLVKILPSMNFTDDEGLLAMQSELEEIVESLKDTEALEQNHKDFDDTKFSQMKRKFEAAQNRLGNYMVNK